MEMFNRPEGWEVTPDEYLGKSSDDYDYYRLGTDVFRTGDGHTCWTCTIAEFAPVKRAWRITTEE
jgi:hypothetical protein